MADGFGEDLFAVFEENPSSVIKKKTENEKKGGESSSATEDSEGTPKFGEKRQFKPDVIDLALDENEAKKAKFDDLNR